MTLFLADLIVRTCFQVGKSPVLQVYAQNLGAGTLLLGAIVSVSTFAGMILKPLFGFLADRRGRWFWLAIGTCLFAGVPFFYAFIRTPDELVALRLVHGMSTAIYGPITLAYVAAHHHHDRAEAFGWFSWARATSYVAGPLIGGAALTIAQPETIYQATSAFALLAFIPVAILRGEEPNVPVPAASTSASWRMRWQSVRRNRSLLLLGITEATTHVAIYAVKGFLPILGLARNGDVLQIGTFLAAQEAANLLLRPTMGRIADRTNPRLVMAFGLIAIGLGLLLFAGLENSEGMLAAAIVVGIGQSAFGPAALALVASEAPEQDVGLSYGVVGAMRNAGKIIGPLTAGGLLSVMSYWATFSLIALVPLLLAISMLWSRSSGTSFSKAGRDKSEGQRAAQTQKTCWTCRETEFGDKSR